MKYIEERELFERFDFNNYESSTIGSVAYGYLKSIELTWRNNSTGETADVPIKYLFDMHGFLTPTATDFINSPDTGNLEKVLMWCKKNLSTKLMNSLTSVYCANIFSLIKIYGKDGKLIKMPKKFIMISGPKIDDVIFQSDSKKIETRALSVKDDRVIDNYNAAEVMKIFESDDDFLKTTLYFKYNEWAGKKKPNKAMETIDRMHDKKWMKDYSGLNDLHDLGIFDD